MARTDTAMALKARLRLRELAQYYSATSTLPETDFHPTKDADGAIKPYDLVNFQPYSPDVSKDPSLTAIAQLAAIRLNCQRSFISLIGESAQHVVAEATRTISLFDKDDFEGDDGIILGAQSIPLTFGVCATTIGVFTGKCEQNFGVDTEIEDGYICIPDLLAEDRTSSLPALKALPPILRFYLEVPLISKAGYVIGSLCVMDTTVRRATPRDVKVMEEMSRLVMRHLELTRMKEDHQKAGRLLEGLGYFLKGKDSISNQAGRIEKEDSASETRFQEAKSSAFQLSRHSDKTAVPNDESVKSDRTSDNKSNGLTANQSLVMIDALPPITSDLEPPARTGLIRSKTDDTDRTDKPTVQSQPKQARPEENGNPDPTYISTRQTFSRAANLIRESMDLDACCFLEIPQVERYRRTDIRKSSRSLQGDVSDASLLSQSSYESSYDTEIERSPRSQDNPTNTTSPEVFCDRLGFATRIRSSVTDADMANTYMTVPTSLLLSLSLKYPQGRIFHFDSAESISSGSDERKEEIGKKSSRGRCQGLSARLLQCFPSAKSLIFFPMYDTEKQQVYAAYFGFTANSARGLQKSELTYISGFSNSIMCEVLRLEAEATDKAKSDFISSISHELRSPLHGILASSQLLSESIVLPKQVEFLEMIETCARTLLDTMNHLLDHAKINHFTEQQNSGAPTIKLRRANSQNSALTSELDLLAVVEETTASMAASNDRKAWRFEKNESALLSLGSLGAEEQVQKSIPLILNVTPRKNWIFESEAGSWRRIIMNLVGNSLKYTRKGHIVVSLAVHDSSKSPTRKLVELKVSDTGQGISAKYLKHKLYTPFAQENNLSVGTGLGLSLVQKIVSSLNGNIEVKSEVGIGTEVLVTIPLEQYEDDTKLAETNGQHIDPLVGNLHVEILGFDGPVSSDKRTSGIQELRSNTLAAIKKSIETILVDMLEARISSTAADIIIVEEAYLEQEMQTLDITGNVLLVLGLDGRSSLTDKLEHAHFIYVLPPIGPKRLIQALKQLLDARGQMSKGVETSTPSAERSLPMRPQATSDDSDVLNALLIESKVESVERRPGDGTIATSPARTAPVLTSRFSPASTKPGLRGPTKRAVLLVDDNVINLRILTAIVSRLNLQKQGIETLTAANGLEALNMFTAATRARTRILMVFMDISMPVMDGFQATREIRAFEETMGLESEARSPIVAVTGLGSAGAQKEIENSGFDLYLRKPVGIKAVREVIAKYIDSTAI